MDSRETEERKSLEYIRVTPRKESSFLIIK